MTRAIYLLAAGTLFHLLTSAAFGQLVFINEVDYDDPGSDNEEFIELVGVRGVSLAGWTIELVNGSDDTVYGTLNLTDDFVFADDSGANRGFFVIGDSGVTNLDQSTSTAFQNGAPDGIRLLDAQGNVVHFASYEGTVTGATDSTALIDSASASSSLYKRGSGTDFDDFSWSVDTGNASPGGSNKLQSITDSLVVYYDFDDGTNTFTNSPEATATGISASAWSVEDGSITSPQGNPSSGESISSNGFDDLDGNAFNFSLTITGGTLNLTAFHFDDDASGSGATNWELFINNVSVATGLTSADFLANHTGDLSISGLTGTVDVRLLGTGASGGTGTWRIDNFVLTGSYVPTPAALPAGLALLGFIAARRRR